jgi:hypothetical protein
LGKQIQNHNLCTGVGVTDIGFAGGTGSAKGNTCCFTEEVGVASRTATGDFDARDIVTVNY